MVAVGVDRGIQQVGRGFGSLDFDPTTAGRYLGVSQILHPAVPGSAEQITVGVADESLRAALPSQANIDKDGRFESSRLLSDVDGFDELRGRVTPSPISDEKSVIISTSPASLRNREYSTSKAQFG